ncbi:hypothetical protein HGRIS_013901 [Hohenbuehelia grisea]|uniref:Uncharacterized protein n=1 Tax=Hohenbuehelia grisea TaxID=104357 RepID=A0ABR3IWU2_9AGAR
MRITLENPSLKEALIRIHITKHRSVIAITDWMRLRDVGGQFLRDWGSLKKLPAHRCIFGEDLPYVFSELLNRTIQNPKRRPKKRPQSPDRWMQNAKRPRW